MSSLWRLQLAGAARLFSTAEPSQSLPLARKDAGWLAWVALNPGAGSLRVATIVWPAASERGALNNLRQRVYRLRQATGARLVEMAETIELASDLQFDDPVAPGSIAADPAACRAELLGGIDFDAEPEFAAWLVATRQASAGRRREALARIASEAESAGELARALHYTQHLLLDEPLSEHAHRRLMRLHYLRGDRAAALAAFEACEQVLKDELGVRPGAETLALLKTVEASGPAAPGAVAPTPVSLLRPPRTVGRALPARELTRAHAAGQTPVLVGEAGLGKTRLLQDFVANQPQAVYVQARPSDAAVPYGALARLLRAVLVAAPSALSDESRLRLACIAPEWAVGAAVPARAQLQAQIQAAVMAVLASAAALGCATLVVDDLHFADRASVEMLRGLIDAPGSASPHWVLAHRPVDAADEDAALLRLLADAEHVCWIRLSPLEEKDIAELLVGLGLADGGSAELVPALARHAGGNPLYVIETLRAMVGARQAGAELPRPASIGHLLDRRLERLSPAALSLARVVAIAAPDFSIELAELVLSTPALALADAWRELERADVLRGEAFAHDLVHDAVRRATPEVIARHAHRQVASFLATRGNEPARVAEHWLGAHAFADAAAAFERASEHARRAGRPREHAQLLLRAADASAAAGDPAGAVRLQAAALLPLLQGQGLSVADLLSRRLVESAGEGPLAALAWGRRAILLMHAGQAAEAEPAARTALSLLSSGQLDLRVEVTAALALALRAAGRGDDSLELLRPWVNRIDDVPDPTVRIEFHSAHAMLLADLDRPEDAIHALQRQLDEIRRAGETGEIPGVLLSQATMEMRRGNASEVLRCAGEAAAAQLDFDEPGFVAAYTRSLLGCAHCALGRYEQGLALLQMAKAMLEPQTQGTVVHSGVECALAEVLLQIGQPARAWQLVGNDPPNLPPGARIRRLLARAAIRRILGEENQALLAQAQAEVDLGLSAFWRRRVQLEAAHRLAPDAALDLYRVVVSQSQLQGDPVLAFVAGVMRLDALRQLQQRAELAVAASDIAERLERCRSTAVYPPEVQLACARAFAAVGQVDAARRQFSEALAWIDRVESSQMPAAFRHGFRHRCAVNVAVRHEAQGSGWV